MTEVEGFKQCARCVVAPMALGEGYVMSRDFVVVNFITVVLESFVSNHVSSKTLLEY
jgi:hypothetical protein